MTHLTPRRSRRHVDRSRSRNLAPLALGVAAVALLAGAAAAQLGGGPDGASTTALPSSAASSGLSSAPASAPSTSPSTSTTPAADAAPADPGARLPGPGAAVGAVPAVPAASAVPAALRPTRISIPAIDVDARVTDLGLHRDGTTEVPTDAREVGWVETTPAPGEQGPAVVAAHVDSSTGPAVFSRLSSLRAGDRVEVTRADGSTARFTVDGLRQYAQDRFPTAAVYGPVPGPALRLVTCGGTYDESRGGYQDNVVVYAS